MNPIIENIKSRRAVRAYEDRPVPREVIETLLDAARWAPSGTNSQPWRFVVVQDASFRRRLAELALPLYREWLTKMPVEFQERRRERDKTTADPAYYNAPVIIFVIGAGMSSALDCPMACQNLMLAARSLGLGSCWVHIGQLVVPAHAEVREALELQEGEKVYGPILVGYPKGGFPEPPARKKLEVKWI